MNQVLNFLNSIPMGAWQALLAGGIISPLLTIIKKWLSIQSERVMICLVWLAAVLAATLHYLLTVQTSDPKIIALQGTVVAFTSQPIYFFAVKPMFQAIEQLIADAKLGRQAQSATIPAEGLPVDAPQVPEILNDSVPTQDFTQ